MANHGLHVSVIDIGRIDNLGWAIEGATVTASGILVRLTKCIDALSRAMAEGPLALGFEAPMFVPYRGESDQLDRSRNGDGDRSFSASAGACVLAKGLAICPYILAKLRLRAPNAIATFDWLAPLSKDSVLLFEAFVTHETVDHVGCAKLAI